MYFISIRTFGNTYFVLNDFESPKFFFHKSKVRNSSQPQLLGAIMAAAY